MSISERAKFERASALGRMASSGTAQLARLRAGVICSALLLGCSSPSGHTTGGGGTSGTSNSAGSGNAPSSGGVNNDASGGTTGSLGGSSNGGGSTNAGSGASSSGGFGAGAAANGGSSNPGGGAAGSGVGGSSTATGGSDAGAYTKPDSLPAETGASLWLRYPKVSLPGRLTEYQAAFKQVVKAGTGASLDAAATELVNGLGGLTGATVGAATAVAAGSVVVGVASDDLIKNLPLASRLAALGNEGYLVEAADLGGTPGIVVAGNTQIGALYGSFALLRHLQMHKALAGLSLSGSPRIKARILNHWDNLDRTVERGYAGKSLWDWSALPGTISSRYKDYARANASIGVNGAVLNNVNADASILTATYLAKVKVLADTFRPYGIKVYLSANFAAPKADVGTADPLNSDVKKWWASKADAIYQLIPDFGGFLVKANSEGQSGPQDYGRTHVDGANMLADALSAHSGIVLWRAFVYSSNEGDRIKQSYEEFKPFDGQFKGNVLIQVKNGPLDFQPREPFSALFGAMPGTPLALELQITKEYLGEDTHLAYLGPLYQEVLQSDTQTMGAGSTIAKVVDGSLNNQKLSAMSGVSNIGDDVNWTGSHMNQANWYVFGRLAWDPDLSAEAIADEWVRETFSNDPVVVTPVVQMMMSSRQILVNYMTPLGLAHIMGTDHHYGPKPWESSLSRPEWNPTYYHKADTMGLGFDRTAQGSDAVSQYSKPVGDNFASRANISEDFVLFFHHVPWSDKMASGRTLWEELVYRYSRGVDDVGKMRDTWASLKGYVDDQRFKDVSDFLQIQHYEARWWRDACLTYFATFSKQQIPSGYAPAANTLSYYQGLTCPSDPKKPRCSQIYTGNPSPAILP